MAMLRIVQIIIETKLVSCQMRKQVVLILFNALEVVRGGAAATAQFQPNV